MTRIKFNALDRRSSASYSKTVEVKDVEELKKESDIFDNEVSFSKFYRDSEILEGETEEMTKALEQLE